MARVTMVKKVLADGRPCRKCAEVEARLRGEGLWSRIHRVVVADERDPEGEGWRLARRHGIATAPFFLVEDGDGTVRVYTAYLRLLREVLRPAAAVSALDLLEAHPELDFV
ncbi:hypothetical protein [Inmirania thermothiophila]|uniref:Glutaredoxin n=1 Tax=Inmirania thermothiophila TaxID=1750597 RepID=A0A3N1Y6C8_9GAMM|nr:hypothetical protein [Inmirania thermothiophila]ROR34376.1 hypothetical protein EDC57_0272 [Inmirania thermothiophila]